MILIELFLTFFKIGLFTFGGGYAMISLIRDDCLTNGWLTEGQLMNFIAVAESTPGPIAINMATFVGYSQANAFGAICATLGVVLPSFIIILLIASVMTRFMKNDAVKAVIGGIRPVVVALILGTSITLMLSILFGIKALDSTPAVDLNAIIILAVVAAVSFAYKKWKSKAPSPILLIILSGIMGVVLY